MKDTGQPNPTQPNPIDSTRTQLDPPIFPCLQKTPIYIAYDNPSFFFLRKNCSALFTHHFLGLWKKNMKKKYTNIMWHWLLTSSIQMIVCCEILKYSQLYEPYRSIVGQEWGRTHRDLNECRKIKSNLNQINHNLV